MKKNGFTLVELLAVIAVLAVLGTISTVSVVSFMNNSNEKLSSIAEDNLKSAVITYLTENNQTLHSSKCRKKFTINDNNIQEILNNISSYCDCIEVISINELKNKGYFTDDSNSCKNTNVIGYVVKNDEYEEYSAYVLPKTCANQENNDILKNISTSICPKLK